MLYKLPADVKRALQNKFPNCKELDEIIDSIFSEIRDKAFNDGSCLINLFGTFYTYKTFNSKKNKYVPRFKFKISRAFSKSFIDDQFLIDKIDKTMSRVFDAEKSTNEKYIKTRKKNNDTQKSILNNQRKLREKIDENLAHDEIASILSEDFNNE